MLSIGICDDNKNITDKIEDILWEYKGEIQLNWKTYLSGESLLGDIQKGEKFDLIFLDIEMGKLSGIDFANILRNVHNDYSTQIAFVTSKENRAKEACKVQPLDFIDKPFDGDDIRAVIDKTIKIVGDNRRYFSYTKDKEEKRILYKDIYYFKSEKKIITIATTTGSNEFRGSLKDIEEKLGDYGFIRTNKSYIINSKNMDRVLKDDIAMINGKIIPVSRDYKKNLVKYLV